MWDGKGGLVGEELADRETDDEGDEEATGGGEGEAEERFHGGMGGLMGKVGSFSERFVGAAKGEPEIEEEEEREREQDNERPVVARTKGEELGEDDCREDRDKDEAVARPVVIPLDGMLLRHARGVQEFSRQGGPICRIRGTFH